MAMLMQRTLTSDPEVMTARGALELATLGGARVLGRDDIGALKPGMAADFIAYNLGDVAYAGALHDPVAALIFCTSINVAYNAVNGKFVVREGRLANLELEPLIERHNALARALVDGESL